MFKSTCLIFCAVAVLLSCVSVHGNAYCRESFKPLEEACLKELGISKDDLDAAIKTQDISLIDSCYFGCIFKKLGVINDKGQYDLNTGLAGLKKVAVNDSKYAKFEEAAKQCEKVKDQAVSDGDAGCEMGALVAVCFWKVTK